MQASAFEESPRLHWAAHFWNCVWQKLRFLAAIGRTVLWPLTLRPGSATDIVDAALRELVAANITTAPSSSAAIQILA